MLRKRLSIFPAFGSARAAAVPVAVGFGERDAEVSRDEVLPVRLQRVARERLAVLGLLLAVLGVLVLATIPLGLLPVGLAGPMFATVVISAMLAVVGYSRLETLLVLRIGLLGLVGYCGVFSFAITRTRYLEFGVPGEATWTCVLLVAFPLLVPARPRETAVALVLGALSAPAGVLWVAQVTDLTVTLGELVTFALSPAAAAVIGHAGARFVYRLGQDVQRAELLGSYRLVRRLGQGGMGEVWEARHARLARPAAIKFIAAGAGQTERGEVSLKRFEREAALTAALRSPHTVEVFDFGVSRDGRFYYAMELLEGLDLQQLIDRTGPMPAERAIHFARQVLESLSEAHARGLVHRDIKPANVFIARYGLAHDFVKVLDFGLARQLDERDARLTVEAAPGGTPSFMAPEVARGEDMDARGDLYAVACLLWWMVTGRPVFHRSRSALAHIYAHANDPAEPPSRYATAPLPPGFDDLVLSALSKVPAERPASAEAFREALDALPIARPWTAERARLWWEDHAAHGLGAGRTAGPLDATVSLLPGAEAGQTIVEPGLEPY